MSELEPAQYQDLKIWQDVFMFLQHIAPHAFPKMQLDPFRGQKREKHWE